MSNVPAAPDRVCAPRCRGSADAGAARTCGAARPRWSPRSHRTAALLAALALGLGTAASAAQAGRDVLAARVHELTRESIWTRVAAVQMTFPTHHPQGLVKIGDAFYFSSVEIRVRTRRFTDPAGGYDRDAGEGAGHLFKTDMRGHHLASVPLGEGTMYHPGGLDYDGTHLWVAVAEYRPNSRAIVYRIDPDTMKAAEVLRVRDHLGAIVHDPDARTLHGVSWGSRRFYTWTLDAGGRVTNADAPLETIRTLNPSHYVDYQDCKYAGGRRMLCTGVADLPRAAGVPPFRLGGLELVDLAGGRPVHQVPVPLWTDAGLPMTRNPAWLEPADTGLRAYFMPEDDRSTLYVYETNR